MIDFFKKFFSNKHEEDEETYPYWDKTTIEDEEKKNMVESERLGPDPIPFGYINYQWIKLLEKMEEGDELYTFKTSDESWQHLAGRAGIALVRDKKIIHQIITSMN